VPATALSFLLFFFAQYLPKPIAIPIVVVCLLGFRTAYALIDVPHNGLLIAIAKTQQERTGISAIRIFFSAIGKLAVTALAALLLRGGPKPGPDAAFTWMPVAMVIVFCVSLWICAIAVKQITLHVTSTPQGLSGTASLVLLFRENHGLRTMFGLTAINSLMTPGIAVLLVYNARYSLGDASIGPLSVAIQSVGQAVSMAVWARLAKQCKSQRKILFAAYAILASIAIAAAICGIESPASMLVVGGASGFAMGGISMLNWALLPEAIEVARQKSQSSALLSVFGLYTIVNKAFQGVAQGLVGLLLGLIGFSAGSGFENGGASVFASSLLYFTASGCAACLMLVGGSIVHIGRLNKS